MGEPVKIGRRARVGLLAILLPGLLLSACVAPVGPVTVTRFHLGETAALGHGPVVVVPAAGMDPASLEIRSNESAVAGELARLGYVVAAPGSAPRGEAQLAELRVSRARDAGAGGSPEAGRVRVSMGGGAGSYGSGVGLGVAFPIGRGSAPPVTTELAVRISDHPGGRALWEGRASFTVAASSPLAQSQLGAPRLAAALFAGFPGNSGQTITAP